MLYPYAECHYAECRVLVIVCRYAECRSAKTVPIKWRHDAQHNDIRHKDTQPSNDTQRDVLLSVGFLLLCWVSFYWVLRRPLYTQCPDQT